MIHKTFPFQFCSIYSPSTLSHGRRTCNCWIFNMIANPRSVSPGASAVPMVKAISQKASKAMSQKSLEDIEPTSASSFEDEHSVEYLKGWHNPQSMQRRPFLSLRKFLLIQLSIFAMYSLGIFVVLLKQGANCKNAPGLLYCKDPHPIHLYNIVADMHALQHLHLALSTCNVRSCIIH